MEEIISRLLKPLSSYCINVCNAQCCRVGKIIISKDEANEISKNIINPQISKREDGYYELNMTPFCPSLKGSLCTIYNTPFKPKICTQFPLFLRGRTLFAASSCPAVREKIINLSELEANGIKVILQ